MSESGSSSNSKSLGSTSSTSSTSSSTVIESEGETAPKKKDVRTITKKTSVSGPFKKPPPRSSSYSASSSSSSSSSATSSSSADINSISSESTSSQDATEVTAPAPEPVPKAATAATKKPVIPKLKDVKHLTSKSSSSSKVSPKTPFAIEMPLSLSSSASLSTTDPTSSSDSDSDSDSSPEKPATAATGAATPTSPKGKFAGALNIKMQKITVRQPGQYTPRGSSYNTPRGQRFTGPSTGVRVKVISDSSSEDDDKNKENGSKKGKSEGVSASDSEDESNSDSDGERLIKDEVNEHDVAMETGGGAAAEVVDEKNKHKGSDDESSSGESSSTSDDDDDDGTYSESESESELSDGKRKLTKKSSLTRIIELTEKKRKDKKKKKGDDDGDSVDEEDHHQKPHKHKPKHKTDVIPEGTDSTNGDKDKENRSKDKKNRKGKGKKGKRRRRKGKKKSKKKKKAKSTKRRILKLLRRPIKYARSSIQCTTITFFVVVLVIGVLAFWLMADHMMDSFQRNDFKVCDNDVDRIAYTIQSDLTKLSDILDQYSKWSSTARAVNRLARGNSTLYDRWYENNFITDDGWVSVGHNLLAVYSDNHTYLAGDYHPSSGTSESTRESAPVPEYFTTKASKDLHDLEESLNSTERCQVAVPKGSGMPMLLCHHPIIVSTSSLYNTTQGYIIMAADLPARLREYSEEISACVSIWTNSTSMTSVTKKALGELKGSTGGITPEGLWGGKTYHQKYDLATLNEENKTDTALTRVCAQIPQFEDTGSNVASFFLFPNTLSLDPSENSAAPLLRVDHPAAMKDFGYKPVIVLTVIGIAFLLIFIVVMLVYLDVTVLRRISSLSVFLSDIANDPNNERQEIPEPRKTNNDPDTKASASSKSSGPRSRTSGISGGAAVSVEGERDVESSSSGSSSESTSTSTSASESTSTSATTSTASSKAVSVASSESTVTGTTTTGTSGSSTGDTMTSSESADSTGDGSSGGGGRENDEIGRLQKAMRSNVDMLKEDITNANLEIRKEHRWRRRHMHALRLMNMWCGRKDIFPGLRGKDKPVGNLTTSTAGTGFHLEDEDHVGGVSGSAAHSQGTDPASANEGPAAAAAVRVYEDMSVDDMLARPIAVEFLKVHSRFEDSQENIFFLLDVTWLRELEKLEEVESDPVKRAQMHDTVVSVADHIVKRYIAKGAPQEINISSESMAIVRKLSGTYSKNMFAKAIYDVKMMTSMDVLSRFKHTPAFLAMSEALDVETYDMMSTAAATSSGRKPQRKSVGSAGSSGPATISTGEIQVAAAPQQQQQESDHGSADARSDAFGGSDDEDEDDINDFYDDDDEDTDDNNAAKIDRPFRSTFRLMTAIADGTCRPNVGKTHFSTTATDGVAGGSDSASGHSGSQNTPRSPRGARISLHASKSSAGSDKAMAGESPRNEMGAVAGESDGEQKKTESKKKKKKSSKK